MTTRRRRSDPGPGHPSHPAPELTAVVLAGGRSSRFGSDKLVATLDRRSLLELAVRAVAPLASEVLVVLAPGDHRLLPTADVPVRSVTDPERHGGPLVGLGAGLEAAAQPIVVVVAGDMPSMLADVLILMTRTLVTADPAIGAVVLRSRGRIVPLPAVVRTGAATDVVRRLIAEGERRLRSVFEHLPTRVLEEGEWRPHDPDGMTIRDVDRPADLEPDHS